jgi:hypothetical protein
MNAIVLIALKRPYTFVVLAILILIFGGRAALRTPTDVFPNIGMPRQNGGKVGVPFTSNRHNGRRMSLMVTRAFDRIIFALACLSLSIPAALGGDGLMITINNDGTDNLFVTVYDRSSSPPQKVLSHTALYGNASISVSISADRSGHGHLSWSAITTDHDMRRCGHKEKSGLNDGDTVNVHADHECAK